MAEEKIRPVLGITLGDINGIGPEVIIKTFADARMLEFCTPVLYGAMSTINYHRKTTTITTFNMHVINSPVQAHTRKINLINVWGDGVKLSLGLPSAEGGEHARLSLLRAVDDAKNNRLDGIVTAPIDKKTIQSDSFNFPGHTEFFGKEFNAKPLMFLVGEDFKCGVVTGHIPLSKVSSTISVSLLLEKLNLMNQSLIKDFAVPTPKIAVLGLNPHAGEDGLLGNEEKDVLIPAIEQAKQKGIQAFGPFPADGFFGTHSYDSFDAVLALYHDQGLIPFKMKSFDKGVNYTAGLPIVRTSPDHGTAYGIAGKDLADESSFREAVYTAVNIIRNRKEYVEIHANPLQGKLERVKEH
jgi:4-hydroxythreonine-4-phosphate dehydrogenase